MTDLQFKCANLIIHTVCLGLHLIRDCSQLNDVWESVLNHRQVGQSGICMLFYCGSTELRDVDKRVIRLQKEQVNELNFCHEWLHK